MLLQVKNPGLYIWISIKFLEKFCLQHLFEANAFIIANRLKSWADSCEINFYGIKTTCVQQNNICTNRQHHSCQLFHVIHSHVFQHISRAKQILKVRMQRKDKEERQMNVRDNFQLYQHYIIKNFCIIFLEQYNRVILKKNLSMIESHRPL